MNLDKQREAAQTFGVQQIPTLIFCQDGAEVDRVLGRDIASFVDKYRDELSQGDDQSTGPREFPTAQPDIEETARSQ